MTARREHEVQVHATTPDGRHYIMIKGWVEPLSGEHSPKHWRHRVTGDRRTYIGAPYVAHEPMATVRQRLLDAVNIRSRQEWEARRKV